MNRVIAKPRHQNIAAVAVLSKGLGPVTQCPAAAKKGSFDDAEVRVALLDQSGGPIEGFSLDRCEPLFRSGFQEVKWTGQSVARLAGKQVRLRFELRNAGLYAFQFQG